MGSLKINTLLFVAVLLVVFVIGANLAPKFIVFKKNGNGAAGATV